MTQYKEDFTRQLTRYHKGIQEMFDYSPRRATGIKVFRGDILDQVITTDKMKFAEMMLNTPKKYYQSIENLFEKWESDLDDFQDHIEEAWERIKEGAKEDMFDQLEDEEDNEYDDAMDIDDYDLFKHFDRSYFITYIGEEIGHNIKGRYPIWDKYIEKDFDYSKIQNSTYIEEVWSPVENTVDNLIQELDNLREWMLARLKLIHQDVRTNKRGYINWIFTRWTPGDSWQNYSWNETKGIWNIYG